MTLCLNSFHLALSKVQCWYFSFLILSLEITVLFHLVFCHIQMNVNYNCYLHLSKKLPENPVTIFIAFIRLMSSCESLLLSRLLNLSSYVNWLWVLKSFCYSPSLRVPWVIIGWILSIGFEPKLSLASEIYLYLGSLSVPINMLSFLPFLLVSGMGCVPQLANSFP